MKIVETVFFIVFLFFFSSKIVLAVNILIDNYPEVISSESFNLNVKIDGPNPGTNFLRIDLYKEGTTNYFGQTWNGNSWYDGSDGKQYYPITISPEGTASAILQGKVGSPSTGEYIGSGTYKLKIRRYTSSGRSTSGDQQTPINVQINVAVPTPTLQPTPTPTASQPTTEPNSEQNSNSRITPIGQKTPTPTKKITPTPSPTPTSEVQEEIKILGENQTVSPEPSPSPPQSQEDENSRLLPKILIGVGILFILISLVFLLFPKLRRYNNKNETETD